MSNWPDAPAITAFLHRAQRRLRLIAFGYGAAAGLLLALLVLLTVGVRSADAPGALVIALLGAMLGGAAALYAHAQSRPTAARIEERAPQSRNVIRTAAELMTHPERVRPSIGNAVLRDAAQVLAGLQLRTLFPAHTAVIAFAAAATLWTIVLMVLFSGASPAALTALGSSGANAPAISDIDIVVTPPSYTAQAAQRLRNPQRIEVLAGSRIEISVAARADNVALETLQGVRDLDSNAADRFTTSLPADADGFIALEPHQDGVSGLRRLIGITVIPDALPSVRITAPAKDLMLPDGARSVDITIDAADDIALTALQLTFTRVSGFGEQFTFTEGEIPLTVSRQNQRTWSARAQWQLTPLQLTPGDMLVYRARARDARPGAAAGESDTYMIEVVVPNAAVAGGVAMDDEFDRYALSQQMVIVLTERLMARRATLPAAEFTTEAQALAAAQRRVRAEFVFMLGGELEAEAGDDPDELHEEAHVRADADVAEGRLANQGRIELSRAIQAMSTAATALSRAEMDNALAAERLALQHVQRAFARTRYILRALNERERIDLSRRLTGLLFGAGLDTRPSSNATVDPQLVTLRRALADIAALHTSVSRADLARASNELAQRVLRIDPAAEALREVADTLAVAADAFARAETQAAQTRVNDALTQLAALVRARVPTAPNLRALPERRLDGAVADALRETVRR